MFHSKFNLKPLFLEKMVFGNIIQFDIKILQLEIEGEQKKSTQTLLSLESIS